jgi:hypothetical protein
MEKFSDVRSMPSERASVFIPQVELLRNFDDSILPKKADSTHHDNNIDKIYDIFGITSRKDTIESVLAGIRHRDHMDPYVLIIAGYLYVQYHGGISTSDTDVYQKLTPGIMNNIAVPMINNIPKDSMGKGVNEKSDYRDGDNVREKIMIDVISYYQQIFSIKLA